MKRRAVIVNGLAGSFLSACAGISDPSQQPEITHVVINKAARKMYLLHEDKIVKKYTVDLGFAPQGNKFVEGDGKTPEGHYTINRRNPNSQFHKSLGISYPNRTDIGEASSLGQSPGGDIFIHGGSRYWRWGRDDWTQGCVAVSDGEMDEIYAMVPIGTPIMINP